MLTLKASARPWRYHRSPATLCTVIEDNQGHRCQRSAADQGQPSRHDGTHIGHKARNRPGHWWPMNRTFGDSPANFQQASLRPKCTASFAAARSTCKESRALGVSPLQTESFHKRRSPSLGFQAPASLVGDVSARTAASVAVASTSRTWHMAHELLVGSNPQKFPRRSDPSISSRKSRHPRSSFCDYRIVTRPLARNGPLVCLSSGELAKNCSTRRP